MSAAHNELWVPACMHCVPCPTCFPSDSHLTSPEPNSGSITHFLQVVAGQRRLNVLPRSLVGYTRRDSRRTTTVAWAQGAFQVEHGR